MSQVSFPLERKHINTFGHMEVSGSKVHQSLYISIENYGLLSWVGFLSSRLGHGELCRGILMGCTQGVTYLCKRWEMGKTGWDREMQTFFRCD